MAPEANGSRLGEPGTLARRASELLASGEVEAARALAVAALRDSAGAEPSPQLHAIFGEIAMRDGDWEEAYQRFEKASSRMPGPRNAANLAESAWRTGRLERALECYHLWARSTPGEPGPHAGMANVLHGLGRFTQALECLDRAERLGEDARVHARRGCICASLGEYDAAEREFSRAAALDSSLAFCRLIAFNQELFAKLQELPEVPAPPVLAEETGATGYDAVIVTSCDGAYFRKYGSYFLASFAQNAPRESLLHMHLYDAEGGLLDEVRRNLARAGIKRYVVSSGRVALAGGTDYTRRVVYSCGRFLYLPAWMERHRKPILAFDIDAVLEGGVERFVHFAAEHDAGLLGRDPADSPWLDIVAYVMVANPTPKSLDYFKLTRNYIWHFLRAGHAYWHIDQIALYCSLRMMQRFAAPPRIAWFSRELLQTAVWHLGHSYDRRLADGRLARYRPADDRDQ